MTEHAGENRLAGSSVHTIHNLTLTVGDYEYSYELPNNTRKFGVRPRDGATIKVSLTSGESGTNFITVSNGGWWHDLVGLSQQKTIYIQSSEAGSVVEIEAWS